MRRYVGADSHWINRIKAAKVLIRHSILAGFQKLSTQPGCHPNLAGSYPGDFALKAV
jgi:hypothetical protein